MEAAFISYKSRYKIQNWNSERMARNTDVKQAVWQNQTKN